MIQQDTKVFISYSIKQTEIKNKIQQLVEERSKGRILVWSFDKYLRFGERVWPDIENSIRECDHFVIILSEDATKSESVQRELGVAIKCRHERDNNTYPTIIGLNYDNSIKDYTIIPRHTEKLAKLAVPYKFQPRRYLDISYPVKDDEIENFIVQLVPKISIINHPDGDDANLFKSCMACYASLFPNPEDQCDPEYIQSWLEESSWRKGGMPWRDILAVLNIGDRAIGMAYFTVYPEEQWVYCSYLGVMRGFRKNNRFDWFIKSLYPNISSLNPSAHGVLFETDFVDSKILDVAIKNNRILGLTEEQNIINNLRNLRRLKLYQYLGARVVLGQSGAPFPHKVAAYREAFDFGKERIHYLMYLPFPKNKTSTFSVDKAVEFIYKKLIKDSYGSTSCVSIPGFDDYLTALYERAVGSDPPHSLGNIVFPLGYYNELKNIACKEGIFDRLEL